MITKIRLQPLSNKEGITEFSVMVYTNTCVDEFQQNILSVYRNYKFRKLASKVDLFLHTGFINKFYNFLSSNLPSTFGLRWFIKMVFNLRNSFIRLPIELNSYGFMYYDLELKENEELVSFYTQYYTDEKPLEYINLFFVIKSK